MREGKTMEINTDVLVVGTGAAGLFCALHLPPSCRVLCISKEEAEQSDSFLAQGGICTLKDPSDYPAFFDDTMRAGHRENDPDAVREMICNAPDAIADLLAFGVSFDRDAHGFAYTREGAHSTNRILHHDDLTGAEITGTLLRCAQQRANITLLPHTTMLDIVLQDDACTGAVVRDEKGQIFAVSAKAVVWATGGIGGLFAHSTNYPHITADALAIALTHGIAVRDVSYIQIHPTVLYATSPGRRFLISESVRGEGAVLLNAAGNRFCDELQPRDVVTANIVRQMRSDGTDHVFLSLAHLDTERIAARFPNIFRTCLQQGIDMRTQPIPVTPAQHYYMGGVRTDTYGRTSCKRLYAVGEAGCNGVHGRNRLASNSLLESLVFAKRAAQDIAAALTDTPSRALHVDGAPYQDAQALRARYKHIVMEAIQKGDAQFYDQWCHDAHSN